MKQAKILTFLTVPLAVAALASAQIRHPGEPLADRAQLQGAIPTVVMPSPDIGRFMMEDDLRGHRPLRYGAVIPTSLDIGGIGRWDIVPASGALVWRLRIISPGAYTIGLVFDRYQLPAGCQLFLYDEGRTEVFGAYTADNNKPNGQLAIEPVTGDSAIVELVRQPWVVVEPRLRIGEVIHDYRNLRDIDHWRLYSSPLDTGCTVDINCPAGANYQTVKHAVMRTLSGGVLCSASLLNNTSQDGTPYMLTAEHCGNMTNGVFLFNYENTTCNGGGASASQTVSGATRLATSAGLSTGADSQLYRISRSIPASYSPHFAGWDRRTSSGSPAASIGHGQGRPKQIAVDNSGAVRSGNAWAVFWHTGILLGGNSGGPLFNGNLRVIGPACCVNNFTCGQQTAYFGRFDRFWTIGNLSRWLDPGNTGVQYLDGGNGTGANCNCPAAPSQLPKICTITPSTFLNRAPATQRMQIEGVDFTNATYVWIGSRRLNRLFGEFTVVDNCTINVDLPTLRECGSLSVSVQTLAGGSANSQNITVNVANDVWLEGAATTAAGQNYTYLMGGPAGSTQLNFLSFSGTPSILPGFLILGMGANFTDLLMVTSAVMPPCGIHEVQIPIGAPGVVIRFYLQSVEFNPSGPPYRISNRLTVYKSS